MEPITPTSQSRCENKQGFSSQNQEHGKVSREESSLGFPFTKWLKEDEKHHDSAWHRPPSRSGWEHDEQNQGSPCSPRADAGQWGPCTKSSHEGWITVSQKAKQRLTTWLSNLAPKHIPPKWKTGAQTTLCTQMFTAALFTVARRSRQPRWMDKQNGPSHTMEYYSAIKRNEALMHATTWMNLENMMLSDRSQTQKENMEWCRLYEIPRISKSTQTESRLVVARGFGKEEVRSDCLMGTGLYLGWWKCFGTR